MLCEAPQSGRLADERLPDVRVSRSGRHLIFYRATATTLIVLAILHDQMDAVRHLP